MFIPCKSLVFDLTHRKDAVMRVELEVSKEHLASQLDLDMGFTD